MLDKKYIGEHGSYIVLEEKKLGQGGQGSVYECYEEKTPEKILAIKICKIKKGSDEQAKKRFTNEVLALKKLQTKKTVSIIDTNIEDEKLWYIMPLLQKSPDFYKDDIELNTKIEFLIELGEIIKDLHQEDYSHRDIKPENLLYDGKNLILSDFGLVFHEDLIRTTRINEKLGPYSFMDPQMNSHVDKLKNFKPMDIFSYGQIAYCTFYNEKYGMGNFLSRTSIFNELNYKTLSTYEPIHHLLEKSTISDLSKRLKIDACLATLKDIREINVGNLNVIKKWQEIEVENKIDNYIFEDEKIYLDKMNIFKIISILSKQYILKIENENKVKLLKVEEYDDIFKFILADDREYIISIDYLKKTKDKKYYLKLKKIANKKSIEKEFEDYQFNQLQSYYFFKKKLIIDKEIEIEMFFDK